MVTRGSVHYAQSDELCLVQQHVLGEDDLGVGCRFQQIRVNVYERSLEAFDELLAPRELRRP